MPKQGRGVPADAGTESVASLPLPDLSGVDLCVLRIADDPLVSAAVDDVLRCPERFTGTWWGSDGGETVSAAAGHWVSRTRSTHRRPA
ncbi:hypothetical protein K378_00201 [Streptomyces sp. Amel2xB2]|nr:hypothetical protein K378_00201 [Streptomyces sp. Amel2xB2]